MAWPDGRIGLPAVTVAFQAAINQQNSELWLASLLLVFVAGCLWCWWRDGC